MSPNTMAIGFLLLLGVAVAAWVLIGLRRSPYTAVQSLLFFVNVLLTRMLWRVDVPRGLPIGEQQGAVIILNHRSSVDPFFIQLVAGRPVHWMVAREYCEHPAFGWFLRICEVIPVNRGGGDTASTKAAIRLAAGGGLIGMLPEGRINMTGQFMLPSRPGAVLIALKARVPVVPCYIEDSPYDRYVWSPFFLRARVRVRFGEPIDLSEYFGRERENGVVKELTRRCIGEIARLAGLEDYQPKIAGRDWKPSQEELDELIAANGERQRGSRA
jgi:1-acyl-sn-glycerol-3-phosphate acyltransferase